MNSILYRVRRRSDGDSEALALLRTHEILADECERIDSEWAEAKKDGEEVKAESLSTELDCLGHAKHLIEIQISNIRPATFQGIVSQAKLLLDIHPSLTSCFKDEIDTNLIKNLALAILDLEDDLDEKAA